MRASARFRVLSAGLIPGFVLVAALACSRPGVDLPDPDLSGVEPQVAGVLGEARRVVLENPDSAEAWGDLGALFDAHLITDPAETCYRRAHELDPDDFRWRYLLAVAREIRGAGTDEVVELFERAAATNPQYAPLRVRLGDALWRRGSYERAAEELRRAIDLAPRTAMAHRRLGQTMLSMDDPQEAAKHLARSITLEPRDLAAYSGLAQALMRLGQTERAREIRERAEGLEPVTSLDDPVYAELVFMRNMTSGSAFERGVAAVHEGAYDRAVADLSLVVGVRDEDASAHYWLGVAHLRAGRFDEALPPLSRAVELDPAMEPARRQLGEALSALGRSEEARAVTAH